MNGNIIMNMIVLLLYGIIFFLHLAAFNFCSFAKSKSFVFYTP
ncbi:Hypothetical protein GbCGDNIH4_7280 [Granulibacter bethesdensis CGDNIH4]|nr:Hypothetical protein GbCGDNIH4_7280 [Granulibacter bethesdensis CGDNIH4]